jgi:hypothetical protein
MRLGDLNRSLKSQITLAEIGFSSFANAQDRTAHKQVLSRFAQDNADVPSRLEKCTFIFLHSPRFLHAASCQHKFKTVHRCELRPVRRNFRRAETASKHQLRLRRSIPTCHRPPRKPIDEFALMCKRWTGPRRVRNGLPRMESDVHETDSDCFCARCCRVGPR